MDIEVTIQLGGIDVFAGTLHTNAKRGVETASFKYAESYLQDSKAFPLAPDMPLISGSFHTQGMFSAFSDAMPDRWGRNLMQRAEARRASAEKSTARTLLEADYLAGVSDETRQGALRFWINGKAVAPRETGVPREVSIPHLLGEAYCVEEGADAEVHDLLSAGSSLGGARPKASIVDDRGILTIAKFPRKSESLIEDTCAWEYVALSLARRTGIEVPQTKLLRVDGKAVLMVERFDREGACRIPYMSALTAIQGRDGESYSYLEIVEFLERYGSCPSEDISQLWLRILFSCIIGNTDDHMRNHGFLWDGRGWRLSPAFDINPTPGNGTKYLSNAINLDDASATIENAMSNAEYYRVSQGQAKEHLARMRNVIADWQRVAKSCGISCGSVEQFRTCFER